MPVIVLGSSGSIPIDPDFDDGGVVQVAGTVLEANTGIVDSPTVPVIGGSAPASAGVGSSTIYDNIITTIPGSVITNDGGFFVDVVQAIPGIPTPNIIATPAIPTPSAPDGGPTIGDFDDDGVVQSAVTTVETSSGGFITNDPIHDVVAVTSTVQASSSTFTQGTITSGTTPAPDAGTIVGGDADSLTQGVITTIPGQVVS